MKTILKCSNVTKCFKKKKVLDDISFKIEETDILALIGPNGAGKTTLIKIILGLGESTKGSIDINGHNVKKDFKAAIHRVGAIVENPDFHLNLTGYTNLMLISNLYKKEDRENIELIIDRLGLKKVIHEKVSKYSLGMKQRLGLAKVLINKPNLIILDEPTNGLDPEAIIELRNILLDLSKEKIGIIISSHNLNELDTICNKYLLLSKGKQLDYSYIKKKKTFKFEVSNTMNIKLDNIIKKTRKTFIIEVEKEDINKIIKKLILQKIKIYSIKENTETLEEIFMNLAGGNEIE
ncbi:MAG: ABC transporter ATP-binding protein [bacterium]